MRHIEEELKQLLPRELKSNVVLKDHTSMGVGGVADYFTEVNTIEELIDTVNVALKLDIPYFVLGGGYNVVVSDIGFPGLVIKNRTANIVFLKEKAEVIADSGVNLAKLLNEAASRDLGGLEFLFGVPGTVGGAVYNNAGAFEGCIGDHLKFATLLIPNRRTKEAKIVKLSAGWMEFSYRQSKLKTESDKENLFSPSPVILSVKIQLSQGNRETILKKMRENLQDKKDKQPLPEKSAGSFFKNIGQQKEQSAGYMLDRVGAKRMRVGRACVSKKHANFIINRGGARASEIRALAEMLKVKVKEEYHLTLDEEIEYVGRWPK